MSPPSLPATRDELRQLLGLSAEALAGLLDADGTQHSSNYRVFTIPKGRSSGWRRISAPTARLLAVQRLILLNALVESRPHPASSAFSLGSSIVRNAAAHLSSALIVVLDLRDFFGTTTYAQVVQAFLNIGAGIEVARLLALLCTEPTGRRPSQLEHDLGLTVGRALPQGAPTSPAIANLVAFDLDQAMSLLANEAGCRYTRYSDDLTLSSTRAGIDADWLLREAYRIVVDHGFSVNITKTRAMTDRDRQLVTGLIVNPVAGPREGTMSAAPRVPRRRMREYRAFLHQCKVKGPAALTREEWNRARGIVAFVQMVSRDQADRLVRGNEWLADRQGPAG